MYFTRFLFVLLTTLSSFSSFSQQLFQSIKGLVLNQASDNPIAFSSVSISGINKKVLADSAGQFVFTQVPPGRYDIIITATGYEPFVIKELLVTTAREINVQAKLKENALLLTEIIVKPKTNKEQPVNTAALVSAKMLSVEEAKRYAGGFDDPARLVAAFAGVSSNINNNGIVVRGNNPKFLQWKMEGIEIPNPNHFADLAVFGGGGLSALSSQVLANSDFFSGAFPAEYNNAVSGVFDLSMRKGSNSKHQYTLQAGLTGLDLAAEGPFAKAKKSSYLINYRYSTLALLQPVLPENGSSIKYQDVSFKLQFLTKKAGVFSVWGIGLADRSGQQEKQDSTVWAFVTDRQQQLVRQCMGAVGLTHKISLTKKRFFKIGSGGFVCWHKNENSTT